MENESREQILARNWSILGGLRNALKDESISTQQREDLMKLASRTEETIDALQPKAARKPIIQNVPTVTVALNGAAFGAAIAAFRICWSWPAWTGGRMPPFLSDTQDLYLYMVCWYALAGAVIFVVARNVLNSITWK